MRLKVGDTIPVTLQLEDGSAAMFPRAILYKPDNSVLATLDLAHVANGYYKNATTVYPDEAFVNAVYIVYRDAGHTVESMRYARSQDRWSKDTAVVALQSDTGALLALLHHNAVVDKTIHTSPGTTTARLRGFASAAAAAAATDGAADGAEGETSRWLIITDYDGTQQIKTHRLVREL